MSRTSCWSEAVLSEIRRLREAGKPWSEIGDTLQVCPDGARRQGYRMGLAYPRVQPCVQPRQPCAVAETQPPGATWKMLTAGTSLDGQLYPKPVNGKP